MSIVDRIMKAYTSKHALSPEQAVLVRAELSRFIDELNGHVTASTVTSASSERDRSRFH